MLKFKDGKFRIMQLADIQDTQNTSEDTLRFIRAAIESEKPDLVVLTGDQLKGYGFSFYLGDRAAKGCKALYKILSPMSESDTPFAYTFGNHDEFEGFSKSQQAQVYDSLPCCVNRLGTKLVSVGNVCLHIKGGDGSDKLAVFLLDTGEKNESGDYVGVPDSVIQATAEECERMTDANGAHVPSIVFEHIPVIEMYRLLEETDKSTPGALKGHRCCPDKYHVLPEEMLRRGCYMRENIACPTVGNGQFDSWVVSGSVIAAYFGHDHNNCFNGTVGKIDLGYTPGCGFNVYGPGCERAVRVFEFKEDDVRNYTSRTVTYSSLLGKKLCNPVKGFIYAYAPSSIETAVPMVIKYSGIALAAGIAAFSLKKAIINHRHT